MSIAQLELSAVEPTVVPVTAEPQHKVTLQELDPLLAGYRKSVAWRSIWQLCSTLVLFVAGWTAMYWSLSVSYLLTLVLAVPIGLLVVRLFIFQHDCGHRSFFTSRTANDWVGFFLGALTLTPYHSWRREHAIHHAGSGDLDRRGRGGEIWTMTVREYQQASPKLRLQYRVFRNPLVLFGIGSFYQFLVRQRFNIKVPKTWKRERYCTWQTNAVILLGVALMSWLVGPLAFFAVHLPIIFFSASAGVWLFYMQHQYEEAFWEPHEDWDYVQAAMEGSSYYRLPKILQWCTGNIGLHHIHHLDARIPNYNLQACHDDNRELQDVVLLSLWESLSCVNAKLWDEEKRKMVGFADALK